jgi:hypothetical protein
MVGTRIGRDDGLEKDGCTDGSSERRRLGTLDNAIEGMMLALLVDGKAVGPSVGFPVEGMLVIAELVGLSDCQVDGAQEG